MRGLNNFWEKIDFNFNQNFIGKITHGFNFIENFMDFENFWEKIKKSLNFASNRSIITKPNETLSRNMVCPLLLPPSEITFLFLFIGNLMSLATCEQ